LTRIEPADLLSLIKDDLAKVGDLRDLLALIKKATAEDKRNAIDALARRHRIGPYENVFPIGMFDDTEAEQLRAHIDIVMDGLSPCEPHPARTAFDELPISRTSHRSTAELVAIYHSFAAEHGIDITPVDVIDLIESIGRDASALDVQSLIPTKPTEKPAAEGDFDSNQPTGNLVGIKSPSIAVQTATKSLEILASDNTDTGSTSSALVVDAPKPSISPNSTPSDSHPTEHHPPEQKSRIATPKRQRKHPHATPHDVTKLDTHLKMAERKGIVFTTMLTLNLEAVPGFAASSSSSSNQRRVAQQQAGAYLFERLRKFSKRCRAGAFTLEHVTVLEQPAVGVGAHWNMAVNLLPTAEHVRELAAYLMRVFQITPEAMAEHSRKARAAKRNGRTYKGAPFHIAGHDGVNLIENPDGELLQPIDVQRAVSYALKSLPDDTIITWGDITATASAHRQAGRMQAYEASGKILQRQIVRSSQSISLAAARREGIELDKTCAVLCCRPVACVPPAPPVAPSSIPERWNLFRRIEQVGVEAANKEFVERSEAMRREMEERRASKNIVKLPLEKARASCSNADILATYREKEYNSVAA